MAVIPIAKHRSLFWSALRRWGERAAAAGFLTVADIRNGDPVACTLPAAAISPPGYVQPGKVLGAAEMVEDTPSVAEPREGVDAALPSTADMTAEHIELSRLQPTGAEPPPESTGLFEVDAKPIGAIVISMMWQTAATISRQPSRRWHSLCILDVAMNRRTARHGAAG